MNARPRVSPSITEYDYDPFCGYFSNDELLDKLFADEGHWQDWRWYQERAADIQKYGVTVIGALDALAS